MSKKFDPELFQTIFLKSPEISGAEYYSIEKEADSGSRFSGLICTGEYPAGTGALGKMFPPPLKELIFQRLVWSLEDDTLFSGLERDRIRSLHPLLKCVGMRVSDDAEKSGERLGSIGLSVYFKGIPLGAFLFYLPYRMDNEKIRDVLHQADKILEAGFSREYEFLWPRFSGFPAAWLERFKNIPESNTLPLDMGKIKEALGDSRSLFFQEVIPGFFGRLPGQLGEMEESIGREDWEALRRSNHRIKGASASLYMVGIHRASLYFEKLIDGRMPEDLTSAFDDLKIETEILISFCRSISGDSGVD